MKELLIRISAKINKNLFTIVVYFCVMFLALSLILDLITGKPLEFTKSRILERLFLGVFMGILFRYVLNRKKFTIKSKHKEGN
jgi:L-cystine uptake protein TcyP (sodium:dicarboxylate symporter family)